MEYNFHPLFSGFPLPLLLLVGLFKLLEWRRADENLRKGREIVSIAAVAGVVLAFASGYQGNEWAESSFKVAEETISSHHAIGRLLFFCSLPWLALDLISQRVTFNRRWFQLGGNLFYLLCLALVIYAGYLGSALVFSHGAGVKIENIDAVRMK